MFKFMAAWRFESPGAISGGVSGEFSTLIGKIAAQDQK
jgi:hypothetical protein